MQYLKCLSCISKTDSVNKNKENAKMEKFYHKYRQAIDIFLCWCFTEMTQSPLASPVVERRPVPTTVFTDPHLQQGLAKIKHEQELQHQLLIQHYRQQQQQLAQEHEKQLQDHIKVNSM